MQMFGLPTEPSDELIGVLLLEPDDADIPFVGLSGTQVVAWDFPFTGAKRYAFILV
jgi:hypothetical protein